MARRRGMTGTHNPDDEASSSRKSPTTYACWSNLDQDLLRLVMMRLGVVDYYSFRGVCKSWRSLACESENMFMKSMPPMSIRRTFRRALKETCHLEDFEGTNFKTILPDFAGGTCVGLTSGYLIIITEGTHDFWLVNPITKKLLHFPRFPTDYHPDRGILVFSPSLSEWVFVVLCKYSTKILFSIEGKGVWNHVSQSFYMTDVYAFKGKIYTLSYNGNYPIDERFRVCELRFSPQPKFTILEVKKPDFFSPDAFVSSGENLYAMNNLSRRPTGLHELDIGKMKWVKPCEKTLGEYAFFRSDWNLHNVVAVKQKSWADPRSLSPGRYANLDYDEEDRLFTARMWYFPHECMNVDCIDA